MAQHGTLLLDEIGEMPMQTQAKLLRILEDSRVRRLGGKAEFEVDVRVVAATNKVPEEAVRGGHLREDLYYRLNVFHVHMPPLRERKADIPTLAEALLARSEPQTRVPRGGDLAAAVLEAFERHNWPGNVRELRNVLERAVILAGEGAIERKHLPAFLLNGRQRPPPAPFGGRGAAGARRRRVGTIRRGHYRGRGRKRADSAHPGAHPEQQDAGRRDPGNQPENPAQQAEGIWRGQRRGGRSITTCGARGSAWIAEAPRSLAARGGSRSLLRHALRNMDSN